MHINDLDLWLKEKQKHLESLVQAQRLDHMLGLLLATARWGNPFLPSSFETMESPLLGQFGIKFCEANLWLIMEKTNCRLEGEGWTLTSKHGPDTSAALFNMLRAWAPMYSSPQ